MKKNYLFFAGAIAFCGCFGASPVHGQNSQSEPLYQAVFPLGGTGNYQTVETWSGQYYDGPNSCASIYGNGFGGQFGPADQKPYGAEWVLQDNLAAKLPTMQNGSWIPGSDSGGDTNANGNGWRYRAWWSQSGIYQMTFQQWFVADSYEGPMTVSFSATYDLASGEWTQHWNQSETNFQGSGCSGIGTTDVTGNYPVTLKQITSTAALTIVNPFATYIQSRTNYVSPPQPVDPATLSDTPGAASLAADGYSAVVLMYKSTNQNMNQVMFQLSTDGANSPLLGALGPFDANYLASPRPVIPSPGNQSLAVTTSPSGCDETGTCTFLALLWGPGTIPANVLPNNSNVLTITATQKDEASNPQAMIAVVPPPVVLVHGLWSSADGAWPLPPDQTGFLNWIQGQYPHTEFYRADYGPLNADDFSSIGTQAILSTTIDDALQGAALDGMAVRTADVVAHSMGGLVTRFFLSTNQAAASPELPPNPVHKLITIGTPHLGSNLAALLVKNEGQPPQGPLAGLVCPPLPPCTLASAMAKGGQIVGTAVQSMSPGSPQLQLLSSTNTFSAIVGEAPPDNPAQTGLWASGSLTEAALNALFATFVPGKTVASALGTPNDTIVAASSANPVGTANIVNTASICDVVHTSVFPGDTGETRSTLIFQQVLFWLLGGEGQAPGTGCASSASRRAISSQHADASPSAGLALDLTGYTQVAASNVTVSPVSGSTLTINSANRIVATSAKTITEVVLFQTVTDPADAPLLYVTQAPFAIPFTPTRLGTASFAGLVVFSDKTFTTITLSYPLQPSGTPSALNLVNVPQASMAIGNARVVRAKAVYSGGNIDVTNFASYSTQSGGSAVLRIGTDGTITATGNGVDALNVSYGGVATSAPISVGTCSYALSPANQVVPNIGGTVSIQVTGIPGCVWAVTGENSWLTLNNYHGSGNGTVTLTLAPNATGSTRIGTITLGSLTAAITQPATPCAYTLSQYSVHAADAGQKGNISVTSACPVVVSSNAPWLIPYNLMTSVDFQVLPNAGSPRTAILMIGTQSVPITQDSLPVGTPIAIQTNPTGLQFTIDGGKAQTAPQTVQLTPGSHTLAVQAFQPGPAGTAYGFQSWSDHGKPSHSITVGTSPATYTANFGTYYQLDLAASPAAGGTFTPASGSYFPTNYAIPITATPNAGYSFTKWTGNVASSSSASTTVTLTAPGSVTANFTLTAVKKSQTITFGALSKETVGVAPFKIGATATSGLAVSFASNTPLVCTVSGTTVTILTSGTCSITASQAGNSAWAAATSVTQTFTVAGKSQTITFGPLAKEVLGTTPPALVATASSGLAVVFTSNSTAVCTVSGPKITILISGTCSITASQTGNSTWAAATPVTQTFTVAGKPQTIAFGPLTKEVLGATPPALAATASSGLTVVFASNNTAVCKVAGTKITLLISGMCSITASQAGNATWAAATPVTQTFNVAGKPRNDHLRTPNQGGPGRNAARARRDSELWLGRRVRLEQHRRLQSRRYQNHLADQRHVLHHRQSGGEFDLGGGHLDHPNLQRCRQGPDNHVRRVEQQDAGSHAIRTQRDGQFRSGGDVYVEQRYGLQVCGSGRNTGRHRHVFDHGQSARQRDVGRCPGDDPAIHGARDSVTGRLTFMM